MPVINTGHHACIGDALAACVKALNEVRIAAYVKALRSHDWEYEHSDDQRYWERGRRELMLLHEMQRELDPSREIWNQHAPGAYRWQ